jgi:hypothetical protein
MVDKDWSEESKGFPLSQYQRLLTWTSTPGVRTILYPRYGKRKSHPHDVLKHAAPDLERLAKTDGAELAMVCVVTSKKVTFWSNQGTPFVMLSSVIILPVYPVMFTSLSYRVPTTYLAPSSHHPHTRGDPVVLRWRTIPM